MTPHATLASLSRHDLISINQDMTVSEALAVVRAHRVHHLPVTQGSTLVGILCSCDLHVARPDGLVSALMKRPVVALDHDASLMDAVSTMNAHCIGSVVLMDGAHARAILTRGDVLFAQPELAPLFVKGRRDCRSHARHLSPSADGYSPCSYRHDPGADGRLDPSTADISERAECGIGAATS